MTHDSPQVTDPNTPSPTWSEYGSLSDLQYHSSRRRDLYTEQDMHPMPTPLTRLQERVLTSRLSTPPLLPALCRALKMAHIHVSNGEPVIGVVQCQLLPASTAAVPSNFSALPNVDSSWETVLGSETPASPSFSYEGLTEHTYSAPYM